MAVPQVFESGAHVTGVQWPNPPSQPSLFMLASPLPYVISCFKRLYTLPGDLGLIPIAEALKSATSRTGVSRTSSHEVQSHVPPGISRANHELAPVALLSL